MYIVHVACHKCRLFKNIFNCNHISVSQNNKNVKNMHSYKPVPEILLTFSTFLGVQIYSSKGLILKTKGHFFTIIKDKGYM